VATLNEGLKHCRAPLIARMDADDWAEPDRLAAQVDALTSWSLNDPRLVAVGSCVHIVDPQGGPVPSMARYEAWINEHISAQQIAAYRFVESPLVHPSVLGRRELFELGYREGDFPEDYELWLRAMETGYRFAKVDRPLLRWVDGGDRLTRTAGKYRREAFDATRRAYLLSGPLADISEVDLWGAGKTGKPWLRWLSQQARLRVRRVYEIDPRKVGQNIHSVGVRHPDQMPPPDGTPLIIAVGSAGARPSIREHIEPLGYEPGKDAWFVA
jgi:glycosyltransferase involved in cell wall biosynthesis